MRSLLIILCAMWCIQISHKSFAQNNDSIPSDSIIKTHDLSREQWQAWDSINDFWLKNKFPLCLKENKLKLSCGNCESIYLIVNFYINKDGKLSKYEIVKDKACGSNATIKLKNCFLAYFMNIIFPPPLRNINIQAHIGNGLKC